MRKREKKTKVVNARVSETLYERMRSLGRPGEVVREVLEQFLDRYARGEIPTGTELSEDRTKTEKAINVLQLLDSYLATAVPVKSVSPDELDEKVPEWVQKDLAQKKLLTPRGLETLLRIYLDKNKMPLWLKELQNSFAKIYNGGDKPWEEITEKARISYSPRRGFVVFVRMESKEAITLTFKPYQLYAILAGLVYVEVDRLAGFENVPIFAVGKNELLYYTTFLKKDGIGESFKEILKLLKRRELVPPLVLDKTAYLDNSIVYPSIPMPVF